MNGAARTLPMRTRNIDSCKGIFMMPLGMSRWTCVDRSDDEIRVENPLERDTLGS